MPQVWLVNPIEKPKRKRVSKPRVRKPVAAKGKTASPKRKEPKVAKAKRTAKQRAATQRMIAANRKRAKASRPKKRSAARKSAAPAPRKRKSSAARRPAKRSASRRRPSNRAASAAGRVLRYRRKNPIGFLGDFMSQLVPAVIGGAGALGTDVLMAVVPLPDAIKTGPFRPVVRVGAAIALGMVAGMVKDKRFGNQVAAGALTVIAYDTMKGMLSKVAGGKIPGLGVYEIPGVGVYEVGPADQLGYYDAGQQVGDHIIDDVSANAILH